MEYKGRSCHVLENFKVMWVTRTACFRWCLCNSRGLCLGVDDYRKINQVQDVATLQTYTDPLCWAWDQVLSLVLRNLHYPLCIRFSLRNCDALGSVP